MDIETSKNLGGIGAILIFIGGLAVFGSFYAGVLSVIGLILVLIALKGMADNYNEAGIFNNALYAFIMVIIGGVAFVGALIASVLMLIANLSLDIYNPAEWTAMLTDLSDLSGIMSFLGAIILAIVVLFVFLVIAVIFFRKSLNQLSAKSGVGMFGTTSMLMLIGAVLVIAFGIGIIIIWIAWLLLAIAFFQIRSQPTQPQPATTPPAPS
jgi:uncharacterized membrane protein